MKILICDDHAVFAESLAVVLKSAGHDVVGVTYSPSDALPVLRGSGVDVCLMDLCFPGTTALDHMAGLRAASPGTRFILLSGHVEAEVLDAALAAGVRGFAHKGQQASDILAMLNRVEAPGTLHEGTATMRVRPCSEAQRFARFLTPREREVLARLVRGESTIVLSREMGITRSTARSHVQSVLVKLGVHSQREAVIAATRDGLVSINTGEWLLALGT